MAFVLSLLKNNKMFGNIPEKESTLKESEPEEKFYYSQDVMANRSASWGGIQHVRGFSFPVDFVRKSIDATMNLAQGFGLKESSQSEEAINMTKSHMFST